MIKEYDKRLREKLFKCLSDLLPTEPSKADKDDVKELLYISNLFKEDQRVFFLGMGGCLMVEVKTKDAKKLIIPFLNKEEIVNNKMDFHTLYSEETKLLEGYQKDGGFYAPDLLSKLIKLLNNFDESILIKSFKDKPMILENGQFRCILAPRIESGWYK